MKKREYRRMVERYERELERNRLAQPGVHDFIVVLDHLKPEFNVGKIFRSADALGAREVHLVGIGPFDPAPAMGSFRHVPARFHDEIGECLDELRQWGYTVYAMDPAAPEPLPEVRFPDKSAFVFGHEEFGLSFSPADFPGVRLLRIPQFGKVQSFNVSIAASIVMYEYVRQKRRRDWGEPRVPVGRERQSQQEAPRAATASREPPAPE